ncbi:MAG: hypothetical protein RBT59_01745 [Arcobacteraceae bacterium]|jgi:hypothetical protein|nr:hypothetical protein [Arcobacteraceae bacterium]
MATYNEKMTDSFATKLRLFIFTKAFCKNLAEYLEPKNKDTILKDFEEFNKTSLDIELTEQFSNRYFHGQKEQKISIMIADEEKSITQEELEQNLKLENYAYFSKGNQRKLFGDNIYDELKKIYIVSFPNIMSADEFKILQNTDSCAYCGITVAQIQLLKDKGKISSKSGRGTNLEIDRKSPNLEYSRDNCCMACYWCNNAKTDEYTPSEFKAIAKGINKIWNKRLKFIGVNDVVCFPKCSDVWKENLDIKQETKCEK